MTSFEPLSEALITDTPCRRCGYNLRGLNVDGRCPECNLEIALTISGHLLRHSNPHWVRRLALGAALAASGYLGIGAIPLLLLVFALLVPAMGTGAMLTIGALFIIWSILGISAWYAGCLFTARKAPYLEQSRSDRRTPWFIAMSTIAFAFLLSMLIFPLVRMRLGIPTAFFKTWALSIFVLIPIVESLRSEIVIGLCALIPNDKLCAQTRSCERALRWPLVVLLVFVSADLILSYLAINPRSAGQRGLYSIVFGAAVMVTGFAASVASVSNGFFMLQLAREFREQAELAATNWSQQSAGQLETSDPAR